MRPSVRLLPIYASKEQKAIKLRKKGWSYGEIAQAFKISKSTAYLWTRKVKLSISAQTRIERKIKEALKKGLIAYNKTHSKTRSQEAAKIRENIKKKASKEIKNLSKKDLKLIGSALYWAEGNTKNRNCLRFTNSNPIMIEIIMKFFRKICNIPDEKIKARVHLYPQMDERKTINYWKRITELPKKNFQKPQFQISRASKKKRPRNTLPYGTLHLVITNTEMTCRVKGWIRGISERI